MDDSPNFHFPVMILLIPAGNVCFRISSLYFQCPTGSLLGGGVPGGGGGGRGGGG